LVVSAYLMLSNMEKRVNACWGVEQGRIGLFGYRWYWAILSIGPLLLGAGFVLSTYLLSLNLVATELDHFGFTSTLFELLPWLMTTVAFTLLFVAVPNCRVPFRYGLMGGVVSAICFELLKNLFGWLVANSSFKLIYGAFAVVPLFLLWVNFLWTIILGGAVLVRTLSENSYSARIMRHSDMLATLRCLALFRERSKTGDVVADKDCVKLGLGLVHWLHLRSLLVQNRWIAVTDSGDYVLSRDMKQSSLWSVAELVALPVNERLLEEEEGISSPEPWLQDFLARQAQVGENAHKTFDISLEALFEGRSQAQENADIG